MSRETWAQFLPVEAGRSKAKAAAGGGSVAGGSVSAGEELVSAGQGASERLVVSYVPCEDVSGAGDERHSSAWFLRRSEAGMAKDAVHALAGLLDTWGVSEWELLSSLGLEDNAAAVTWPELLEAVRELPVSIGGEKELRAALEGGRRGSSRGGLVNVELVRSKIEAHYWCLVAKGLRQFVGPPATTAASRASDARRTRAPASISRSISRVPTTDMQRYEARCPPTPALLLGAACHLCSWLLALATSAPLLPRA